MANPLVVNVDTIEEPRQLFELPLTRAFLEEVFKDAPAYKVRGPAELQAHLTRVGGSDVLIEASTTLQLQSACRRCLSPVDSDVPIVFTLNLVARRPEPPAGKRRHRQEPAVEEEAGTLAEDELDDEVFDGEKIDFGPIAREQLLLGLPAIEPLCQEACKGLCSVCGQDLNEKDCGHSQKEADPRWGALKGIKVQ